MRATVVVVPPLAASAELMREFTHALERTARVVVIEPPGFGASPSPSGLPSTRSLARALVARWEERGIGRASLFGISLGGMIAQWVAIDAPALVERLVLASTASRGTRVVAKGKLCPLALARCLVGSRADAAACIVGRVLADGALPPDRRADVMRAARSGARPKRDLAWLAMAAAGHDAEAELGRIRAPTLIVSGAEDRILPARTQAELAARIGGATQVVLSGCGHAVALEKPEEVAALVSRFVR
ncbi:MAG TPA: alpha/beta fold hydrolase [Sandaracinaceae bacterium]